MKKLGLLIAILVLSFSVVAGTAVMAADYGDNDISYDYFVPKTEIEIEDAKYVTGVEDDTAVVVGVTVTEGSAVVPSTVVINDVEHTVTAIHPDAFANSTAAEIRLPNTITTQVTLNLDGFEGYIFVQPLTTTAVAIPVTGTPEQISGVYYKGDYNANGETDVGDVIGILKSITASNFDDYKRMACDVVKDGAADVSDAIRLLKWIAVNTVVLD